LYGDRQKADRTRLNTSFVGFLRSQTTVKRSLEMALLDYLWLIKFLIELLKLLANLSTEERQAIHNLHAELEQD